MFQWTWKGRREKTLKISGYFIFIHVQIAMLRDTSRAPRYLTQISLPCGDVTLLVCFSQQLMFNHSVVLVLTWHSSTRPIFPLLLGFLHSVWLVDNNDHFCCITVRRLTVILTQRTHENVAHVLCLICAHSHDIRQCIWLKESANHRFN